MRKEETEKIKRLIRWRYPAPTRSCGNCVNLICDDYWHSIFKCSLHEIKTNKGAICKDYKKAAWE